MESSKDNSITKDSGCLYVIEDTNDDDKKNNNDRRQNTWTLFLKLLFHPAEGWKNVKRSNIRVESFAQQCFYPMLAIASCCRFLDLVYNPDATLQSAITDAVIIFISFFLGYFLAIFLSKLLLPGEIKKILDKNFGKLFVMMSMCSLALFSIFRLAFPMLEPVLVFLSIYTMYLINRGMKPLRIPQNKSVICTVIFIIIIIGTPYMLDSIFSMMLPK